MAREKKPRKLPFQHRKNINPRRHYRNRPATAENSCRSDATAAACRPRQKPGEYGHARRWHRGGARHTASASFAHGEHAERKHQTRQLPADRGNSHVHNA